MSSFFSQKQGGLTLDGLPIEIRLLILRVLVQDGYTLSRLATVSRSWQAEVERYNFARIKLTSSRIADFGSMLHRNRALVKYIWFCLELEDYDCTMSAPTGWLTEDEMMEMHEIVDTDRCPVTKTIQNMFSVLSTWDPSGELTLDIDIYSHSDSKNWFQNVIFNSDIPLETICRLLHAVMDGEPFDSKQPELRWDQLPSAPVVTKLLLRQQNGRRWRPDTLAHMFARLPRLEEIYYEPWTEWDSTKRDTDRRYRNLFRCIHRSNFNLKRLVICESVSQKHPALKQRILNGADLTGCDNTRIPDPAVSRMVARASVGLEHLAASFIVEAKHFFAIEPLSVWSNLTLFVLTSRLLAPDKNPNDIGDMLETAAIRALKMPRLEIMEIWNGRRGLAALFKYQVSRSTRRATITWRATWDFAMKPSTIQAWEAVIYRQYGGWNLNLVQEQLKTADIKSHGDATQYLKISSQVVRPVSLQQIRREQKTLEGVQTV